MTPVDREGKYTARAIEWGIRPSAKEDSQSVSVNIKFLMLTYEGEQWEEYQQFAFHNCYIVGRDGNINDKSVRSLCEALGWGGDIKDFEPDSGAEFTDCRVTIEAEEYDGKNTFKIKWINPLDGGGMSTASDQDVAALGTRLGAKFRAIAGDVKMNSKPPAPPPPETVATGADENPF